MSDFTEEMKAAADYAIKSAMEKFGQQLDFSEESIAKLDIILGQIYQSFSELAQDEEIVKEITDTALIWGSFLGEYMCAKWGGKWILNGSEKLVSILNIEFSPINFVYQKITSHPEYSAEIYLFETKKIIYLSVINPQSSQYLSENAGQPIQEVSTKPPKKNITFDKRLVIPLASIGGLLLVIFACIIGYKNISAQGKSAFGLFSNKTSVNTLTPTQTMQATVTVYSTNTQIPTITTLPTYTPRPTYTSRPSYTPYPTSTKKPTLTPSLTFTPVTPTRTYALPTLTEEPTNPPAPPTPFPTVPPPVVLDSCSIDPSIVPINSNVSITFIAHFSSYSAGYGFDTSFNNSYPDQSGCSGVDGDGDGLAYCSGSSGTIDVAADVYVTFSSPAGECVASYSAR